MTDRCKQFIKDNLTRIDKGEVLQVLEDLDHWGDRKEVLEAFRMCDLLETDEYYLERLDTFLKLINKTVGQFIEDSTEITPTDITVKSRDLNDLLGTINLQFNEKNYHTIEENKFTFWFQGWTNLICGTSLPNNISFSRHEYIKIDKIEFSDIIKDPIASAQKYELAAKTNIPIAINNLKVVMNKVITTKNQLENYINELITIIKQHMIDQNIDINISYKALRGNVHEYQLTIKILNTKRIITSKIRSNILSQPVNITAKQLIDKIITKINPSGIKKLDYSDIREVLLKFGIDPSNHYTNKYSTTTTYKVQGNIPDDLLTDTSTLNKIKDELINIGFNVKNVTCEESIGSRSYGIFPIPTLYIRVYNT